MKHLILLSGLPTMGTVLHGFGIRYHCTATKGQHRIIVPEPDWERTHLLARLFTGMVITNLAFHLRNPKPVKAPQNPPWDPAPIVAPYPDLVRAGSAFGRTARQHLGTEWLNYCATGATSRAKNAGVGAQSR